MYSFRVLFIAALAGTSLSQKSDSEFCSSFFSSFFSEMEAESPTTPAAILSFIASETISALPTSDATLVETLDPALHQSQLCSLATALPSSLLPDLETLAAGLLSFGKAHESEYIAYVTDCYPADEVAATTSYFKSVFAATANNCDTTPTPTPGAVSNGTYPTAVPTATSAFNGTTNSTTSLIPTAAAARPTGALLGAAAMGGILGAAAML